MVVAATNNPDAVDPAIRRSGRLDRHVRIPLPDVDGLTGILRTCLGAALPGASLRAAAVEARGMTGADVAAAVRRARGTARRAGRELVPDDVVGAVRTMRRPLVGAARERTAIHEAGHGLAFVRLGVAERVSLSLNDGGGLAEALGCMDLDEQTEEVLGRTLAVALAGRAAEEHAMGSVSAGAVNDLAYATRVAALAEARWGFSSERALVSLGAGNDVDLARFPWLIAPVEARLRAAYERARALIAANGDALARLAAALSAEGYLDDGRVRDLVAGGDPDAPGPVAP